MQRSVVTFCALTALVVVALPHTALTGTIAELCADRWPSDKAMRKICIRRQAAGAERAQRFIDRHDIIGKATAAATGKRRRGPYLNLFDHCGKLWNVAKIDMIDFEMFARCLYKEGDAHNPRRGAGSRGNRRRPYGEPPGDRLEDKLSPFE